jgi:hypothetical protein
MALAILNRGSDIMSSGTSLSITPTSNFGANSFAVLFVLIGDYSTGSITISDSNSNRWEEYSYISQFDVSFPYSIGMWISKQLSTLTTGDTVDFDISTTEKAALFLYELTFSSGKRAAFIKPYDQHGSGNLQIVPSSNGINTGDGIIAWGADYTSVVFTGDTDTLDGTWSAIQTENAANFSAVAQSKILTGTSTQDWFPDTGTTEILGYFAFREHSLPDRNTQGFFGL